MARGHRDYDESEEGPRSHVDGVRTDGGASSALESMMPGRMDRGSKGRRSGGGISTFDAQGSVGHQFTVRTY